LASDSRGGQEPELVLPTFRNDLQSAVNMLLAVREFGCERLILLGSLEEPTLEMNIPASPYAAAKLAVTAYAQMFHAVYGVPVVMLRTFMSYGPGQKPFKLIPYVVNTLLRGERPLVTSGQRMVDWVYIDDVVEGILRAMLCPDIEGARIDLGSGTLASVRSVVDRIDKIVDGPVSPKFGAIPERLFESERVADLGLARQLLDWEPRTDLNTGLKATIEFYRRALEGGSPAGLAAE
jgi:nucleoside-diphosphate-sugar epimerase